MGKWAAIVAVALLLVATMPSSSEEGATGKGETRQILRFAVEPLTPYRRAHEFASTQEEYCRAHGFERKPSQSQSTSEGPVRGGTTAQKREMGVRSKREGSNSFADSGGATWAAGDINHELKSEIATHLDAYESGRLFSLTMGVGTPPTTLSMLVDTTSRQFVVPSADLCHHEEIGASCSNTSASYRASYSDTCQPLACSPNACEQCLAIDGQQFCAVSESFLDFEDNAAVRYNATLVTDIVSVQQLGARMQFGAYYYQSDLAYPDPSFFDGIVGFGPTTGMSTGSESQEEEEAQSWLDQLSLATGIDEVFSLCLSPAGGLLSVGGSDVSLFVGALQHVQYYYDTLAPNPFYQVPIKRLEVDGTAIELDSSDLGSAIFASSNPFIEMNNATYEAVTEALKSYCTAEKPLLGLCGNETFFDGYCYAVDPSNFEEYPVIDFIIGENEAIMTLDAHSYLQLGAGDFLYCSTLRRVNSAMSNVILGTPIFFHYYMVFDQLHTTISYARRTSCTDRDYILEIESGDNQEGYVLRELEEHLEVIVRNYNDSNAARGVPVVWSVLAGKGVITEFDAATGPDGIASATFKLGPEIGSNIVVARVENAFNSPVYFISDGKKSIAFYTANAAWLLVLLLVLAAALVYHRAVEPSSIEEGVKSLLHRMSEINLANSHSDVKSDCEPPRSSHEDFSLVLSESESEIASEEGESKGRMRTKQKRASVRGMPQHSISSPIEYTERFKQMQKDESASLLEWADVHSQPVRKPAQRPPRREGSESSSLLSDSKTESYQSLK